MTVLLAIAAMCGVAVVGLIDLGSLLAALAGFALAFALTTVAGCLWDSDRRILGGICLVVVFLLGVQSTFGLLLGFDLWSLWRLL